MKLRNVFMTAIACSVLVIAAGTNKNNGMTDTSDSGANGSMLDTLMTSGVVEQFSDIDSMLVIKSDTATDTLYITPMSQMPPTEQLKKGARVNVRYVMEADRKVVIMVESAEPTSYKTGGTSSGNKNGSGNGEKMTSGTVQDINEEDSMIVLKSNTGTDTLYFTDKTKMDKSKIKEDTRIEATYKYVNGKKIATKIMPRESGKGQGSYQ